MFRVICLAALISCVAALSLSDNRPLYPDRAKNRAAATAKWRAELKQRREEEAIKPKDAKSEEDEEDPVRSAPGMMDVRGMSSKSPMVDDFKFNTTARTTACLNQFAHLDPKERELLSEPGLLCLPLDSLNNHLKSKVDVESSASSQVYLSQHVEVAKDPVKARNHVIVIGPESSGTHFIQTHVAKAFGIECDGKCPEFLRNKQVSIMHVPMPAGMDCEEEQVPVLDDFGVKPGHYPEKHTLETNTHLRPDDVTLPNERIFINIAAMVERHRNRGDKVKVIQVARDPEITLASKMKTDCSNQANAQAEQLKALKIMVDAMKLPEVTTLCYEEMLEEGTPYIMTKLRGMGLIEDNVQFPDIKNPDADRFHTNNNEKSRSCDTDAMAYMRLCPASPHSKLLKSQGCHASKDL